MAIQLLRLVLIHIMPPLRVSVVHAAAYYTRASQPDLPCSIYEGGGYIYSTRFGNGSKFVFRSKVAKLTRSGLSSGWGSPGVFRSQPLSLSCEEHT